MILTGCFTRSSQSVFLFAVACQSCCSSSCAPSKSWSTDSMKRRAPGSQLDSLSLTHSPYRCWWPFCCLQGYLPAVPHADTLLMAFASAEASPALCDERHGLIVVAALPGR